MHYKTNRLNHDFQIAYFIAGSCQTPDAAWSILSDLKEDRENAIKSFEANIKRQQAKELRARRMMESKDEADRLEGQADIEEMLAMQATSQRNYDAALDELATIQTLMSRLEPLRKYGHLPDRQAHEAAQQEEWKLQLIHTAENHLFSSNHIPADHFATMRMHPEFSTAILPALETTKKLMIESGKSAEHSVKLVEHLEAKKFDVPKLLGIEE